MKKILLALTLTALACGGCANPYMAWPNWGNPGTAKVQRLRAERFDPYPETNSHSEMTGVRPRDYDKPSGDAYKPWSPWPAGGTQR